MLVNIILDLFTSSRIGKAFTGCSGVHDCSKVAKQRTTRRVLEEGKVCSIRIARVTKGLASRCSPEGGALTLSSPICGSASMTTVKITTRRYNRTMRRFRKCTPLSVHKTLIPIMGFNSVVS